MYLKLAWLSSNVQRMLHGHQASSRTDERTCQPLNARRVKLYMGVLLVSGGTDLMLALRE